MLHVPIISKDLSIRAACIQDRQQHRRLATDLPSLVHLWEKQSVPAFIYLSTLRNGRVLAGW